ncbi:cation transporting ATPase C-terminal domain-containing protein, partial [Stutzerimonas stutzeri]
LLGLALPITPVQVLWVNMVSSVALAMVLAFEPTEADVMQRPPRRALHHVRLGRFEGQHHGQRHGADHVDPEHLNRRDRQRQAEQ